MDNGMGSKRKPLLPLKGLFPKHPRQVQVLATLSAKFSFLSPVVFLHGRLTWVQLFLPS